MNRIHAILTMIPLLFTPSASAEATNRDLQEPENTKGHVYETEDGSFRYEWPRLSNEYVKNASLDEIVQWLRDQNREYAGAMHIARRAKRKDPAPQETRVGFCGGPIYIISSPDALLPEQWKTLALRVRVGMTSEDPNESKASYSMLNQIQQSIRGESGDELMKFIQGNDQLGKLLDQLEDQDLGARLITLSTISILYFSGPPPAKEAQRVLLRRIEESLYFDRVSQGKTPSREETQELGATMNILSTWRLMSPNQGAFDEEFAHDVIRIAECLPQNDHQKRVLLSLLGHVHGAPDTVGRYMMNLLGPDSYQNQAAFHIMEEQVSFYDNKDPISRNIAVDYMLKMLRVLNDMSATYGTDESMLMGVAGSAHSLGPRAKEVAHIYIDLLDHDDSNVRMMAVSSVGYLGEAGRPALPRLHEMADEGGDFEISIRESIYMISGEGEKPRGYDRMIDQKIQALLEAGFSLDESD